MKRLINVGAVLLGHGKISSWVGSQQINVMTLMLETLDVVEELAELTASHTHHNTGTLENASAIKEHGL
ncbi:MULTISPECIES: hypothetical protein [Photorhabdus]|uniref:hypothetical protein n=1 Tax=Photorhabdus TaxID=29487 RepID=UPI00138DE58C|nr:hypothetical protein [Photorhabdus thracensis]MCC8419532.1 hypothetical protein [Photorhabdus thracensis]